MTETPPTPMTAREVAELFGVALPTVHRWIKAGLFDVAPTMIPSPSGGRDRPMFDRVAIMMQFDREQRIGAHPPAAE
jgi:predicted site-specific integrase-resolvase